MSKFSLHFFVLLFFLNFSATAQKVGFFPERGANWEQISLEKANFDSKKLAEAIQFAQAHEYAGSRDLRQAILKGFQREPFHQILGPTKKRGGPAGMILKNGYLVAQWGDTRRVDMTFSVTKSFLSTLAGLALDQKLIRSVDDSLKEYVWDDHFKGEHNSKITWRHLLTQSSDWSGQLWGGYDWADRPPREGGIDDWKLRELREPGSFFEYNDVRVNLLAYSLLQVHRQALPQVLKQEIMNPIGASSTWRWYGYENSWVNIDGLHMQSVSGGGHSGGGLFISTEDMARFGLLFLNRGVWKGQRLLSENWIETALSPSAASKVYGCMWWLKAGEKERGLKNIGDQAFYAAGFGGNYIVIDPEQDLVIITRWLNPADADDFMKKLYDALP